jgi:tRNA pseudouridine55 synthase
MTASGFFYIDKPEGMTSHSVVSRMRKALGMKKVGHSGTLDPMATGVLIIACGTSTRLLDYVQSGTKEYVADVLFGVQTSTGDREGDIIDTIEMSALTRDQLRGVLPQFIGEIQQIPPMVSAIKVDGKKLYEYEREGTTIERKPRDVVIESIACESFEQSPEGPRARLRIRCHAGTYIRTLAEDIARKLGGCAHLTDLRRTRNGNISEEDLVPLDEVQNSSDPWDYIHRPLDALEHYPHVELDEEQCLRMSHGKVVEFLPEQEQLIPESAYTFIATGTSPELLAVLKNERPAKSHCVIFFD